MALIRGLMAHRRKDTPKIRRHQKQKILDPKNEGHPRHPILVLSCVALERFGRKAPKAESKQQKGTDARCMSMPNALVLFEAKVNNRSRKERQNEARG